MIKKVSLVILSAILIFTTTYKTNALNFTLREMESQNELKEIDRNFYYVTMFQKVINSFPVETEKKYESIDSYKEDNLNAEKNIDMKEVIKFPEEYAGAYIDETNALHIILTKSVETEYNYQKITDYDKGVVFDYANFSLSQLYEIQHNLDIVMQKYSVETTVLNEIKNVVEIELLDSLQEKDIVEYLKSNIIDFKEESIFFKVGKGVKATATTNPSNNAISGSKIINSSDSQDWATIGFNAYNGQKYGLVTAGHFATSGKTLKNSNGTTIGSMTESQFSGNVDAAFVPFSSSITKSYKVLNGFSSDQNDNITDFIENDYAPVGMNTEKHGAATGHNSGAVVSASVTVNVEGRVTLTDLMEVSNEQDFGDSGGPVLNCPYTGYLEPGYIRPLALIGIACEGKSNGHALVSKAQNVFKALSVSLYRYIYK